LFEEYCNGSEEYQPALEIKNRLGLIPGATVADYYDIVIDLKNLHISESATHFVSEQLVRFMLGYDLEQLDITRAETVVEITTLCGTSGNSVHGMFSAVFVGHDKPGTFILERFWRKHRP
jgi:hypothetical protein